MIITGGLMWDMTATPEPGRYGIFEPWGYTDGDVTGFSVSEGVAATLLINGEPWQRGASLKCGDVLEVKLAVPKPALPRSHVDFEFSTGHQECVFDAARPKEEFHD